ncbi:MAG: YceI family protein [Bacteroidia bacterium]|nr:YceI family protein [Bacteroidia bacterium]
MKKFLFAMLLLSQVTLAQNKIFICKDGTSTFFSETPIENIEATSKTLSGIINTTNNEVSFLVAMKSYKFEKPLMQEHFNEKYIESDKYPNATFKGKINETIDYTKDGTYNVTATGVLTIHGVDKNRIEKGTLTINGEQISLNTKFDVNLVDHNIEVPKIVVAQIAKTIKVTNTCIFTPYIARNK